MEKALETVMREKEAAREESIKTPEPGKNTEDNEVPVKAEEETEETTEEEVKKEVEKELVTEGKEFNFLGISITSI